MKYTFSDLEDRDDDRSDVEGEQRESDTDGEADFQQEGSLSGDDVINYNDLDEDAEDIVFNDSESDTNVSCSDEESEPKRKQKQRMVCICSLKLLPSMFTVLPPDQKMFMWLV